MDIESDSIDRPHSAGSCQTETTNNRLRILCGNCFMERQIEVHIGVMCTCVRDLLILSLVSANGQIVQAFQVC